MLDIPNKIYVGGAEFGMQFQIIVGLQSSLLRKGFIGCVKSIQVDDVIVDLQVNKHLHYLTVRCCTRLYI